MLAVYMRLVVLTVSLANFAAIACMASPGIRRGQASRFVALVENSTCDIDVRLPSMPSRSEAEAANFLAECLSKVCSHGRVGVSYFGNWRTGAKNPIYMSVSKNGGFSDGWNGEDLFISYPSPEMSMFAAAGFLSKYFNIDFFAPAPLGFNISKVSAVRIPKIKRGYKPSFSSVVLAIIGEENEKWRKISSIGASGGMANFSHNLGRIFTPEVFEEHPDFFSRRRTIGGKYVPSMIGQPDVLNVKAQEFAALAAEKFFRKNPRAPMFPLGIRDTPNIDQRPEYGKFRRGYFLGLPDWSNAVFKFSNAVADRAAHDGKYIGVLAYSIATNPPDFKMNPSIVPYICSDRANRFDKNYTELDNGLLDRWAASGVSQWGVYEYFYGTPYFIPRETENFVWEPLRRAYLLGARLYYAESFAVWAYDAHKLWILTRLLQDINEDPEKLRGEFFRKYYGPAALCVSEFFDTAAEAWTNRKYPPLWLNFFKSESSAELLSKENLTKMRSCLERAAALADTPVTFSRVRELKLVFDITEAAWNAYHAKNLLFTLCNSDAGPSDVAAALADLLSWESKKLRTVRRQASTTLYPKPDFSWLVRDTSSPVDLALKNISKSGGFIPPPDFPMSADLEFEGKIAGLPPYYSAEFGFEYGRNLNFLSNDRAPGLSVYYEEFEDQRFGIYAEAAEKGNFGVLFENCSNSGIGASASVSEGSVCRFEGRFKSGLMPGSMCYASMAFYDKGNLCIGRKTLVLPWSSHGKFWDFYLCSIVPPKAVRADYSIFASRMRRGEMLFIDSVRFESKKTGNADICKGMRRCGTRPPRAEIPVFGR